ncbi:MAG: DUF4160 domain-containing protein [Lachnospiraceae bacterium]|nr:DUF4160 domain-containing protein [Lachnospiraceae bacterium]
MPVLSRFYGIIIRMYFLQSEHNPPHIHAIYNEDVAAIDFMTGDVLEGHLPPKALAMVREWISFTGTLCRKFGKRRNSNNFRHWNKEACVCFTR